MAGIDRTSAAGAKSADRVSKIKEIIGKHAKGPFSATLGQERDIVNIIAAQYYLESRFNPNAIGPRLDNKEARNYISSSAIRQLYSEGTAQEKANIDQGLFVLGLGQVTGHYMIRKAGPSGKCEIERLRPDLAGRLCIDPGEDLFDHILGEENMSKAIEVAMVILEGKYKNVSQTGAGSHYFKSVGDRSGNVYPSKISAAIAGYFGLGMKDVNGTTPVAYATTIVGGAIYETANGTSPIIYNSDIRRTVIASGPSTNGQNRSKVSAPGCG